MKRSQATTTASSCSSTSSSPISIQSEIKRVCNNYNNNKHPRRNLKSQNFKQNDQTTTTTTSRRSSIYRGVTRHRWTGRFEAHLWDKTSWNNIQNKKGRQVYLGAYDSEEAAARTYDLAALKYWGKDATLNFPIERYVKEVEEMEKASKEEYLASLRRQSSGFSRGISKYRGVARHHHNGRWEARIGRVCGNKYLYLGTYKTQEEAAVAYDLAAIEHRGVNAVTNFDINNYIDKLKVKNEQPLQIEEQEPQAEEEETAPNSSDSENAESLLLLEEKTTITKTPPAENHHMIQPQLHTHEESSLITVMDHVLEQDLPWSFMYSNSSQFQVTSLGLSKAEEDLMNMLDGCSGFEEDIDFLFSTEAGYTDGDVHISEVLDGIECGGGGTNGNVDNNNINKQQQQQQQKLLSLVSSSSSSPSSTTTVSCNYSL